MLKNSKTRPLSIKRPDIIPHNPTIEPTDKSIPAVNITKVIPIASMALIATCLVSMIKFVEDKNASAVKAKNEKIKIKAIKALNLNNAALIVIPFIVYYPCENFTKLSSVSSGPINSLVILPLASTKTRSATAKTSFISDETKIIDKPLSANFFII